MDKISSIKNPIIPRMGICDPHIHIYKNKAYLYATHDYPTDMGRFYSLDWEVWSSPDLVTWRQESVIRPEETYIGKSDHCWAVDAAERNGKYYFYFSNFTKDTGVMVSDEPGGPFRLALDAPLLQQNLTPTRQYDPAVFIDDDADKTPYIIFGTPVWAHGDSYYIAKLNDDMISIAESPKKIILDDTADDKPFIHKYRGKYYLSWASYYAISYNVYGPYRKVGNIGVSPDHGAFFEWNNQWFNAFTIFEPTDKRRSTGICYIHYKDNGDMVADQFIVEHGVGQYDAGWNKIEAEWFMAAQGISKEENGRFGFDIGRMNEGSYVFYPKIHNVKKDTEVYFYAACISNGARIDVREDAPDGKLLGICEIANTKTYDWMGYRTFGCKLENSAGTKNLYFVFHGDGDDILRLDWFRFF